MNKVFSVLLLLVVATICSAFTPVTPSPRLTNTCLNARLNRFLRGGKGSWEFEDETMYVEEPAPKKKAAPAAKKAAPKKAAPQKKTAAKMSGSQPKSAFASLFGK